MSKRKPTGKVKDEGVAQFQKKKARRDSLAPDPGIGPPPLALPVPPVQPPIPVAVPRIQELMTLADARSVSENINILHNYLITKDAEFSITSDKCALQAVCWNWTFKGAAAAAELPDANWAYLYVSQSPHGYVARTMDVLAASKPAVATNLALARASYKASMTLAKEKEVHEYVLKALLAFYDIRESGASRLKIIAYYRKRAGLMYHHYEFDYNNAITITKGNGEALKAFNGESVIEGRKRDYDKVILGIDIDSLSAQHKLCIRHLCAKAEELQEQGQ